MPGGLVAVMQAGDLMAAQFGEAPGLKLTIVLRKWQVFAVLQLSQQVARAVINGGSTQGGVAADLVEQGFGALRRVQCVGDQVGVCGQLAQGLQGLRSRALVGDPVRDADKRQVGHQQYGGQQGEQGGQQLLAYREVFKALAQGHEMAI